ADPHRRSIKTEGWGEFRGLYLFHFQTCPRFVLSCTIDSREGVIMKRAGILGWVCVVGCASLLFARAGVVRLTNGQTYEGDVDEKDPTAVTITARGITTRLDRRNIASISYADSAEALKA